MARMPPRIARRMGRMTQKTRASHQGTARAALASYSIKPPLADCLGRMPPRIARRMAQKTRASHQGRTRAALVAYCINPSRANCPPHGAHAPYFWRAWVKSICWSGETVIPRTFLLRP